MDTQINGINKSIVWWGVKTKMKANIGMGNFDELGLQLIQFKTVSEKSIKEPCSQRKLSKLVVSSAASVV